MTKLGRKLQLSTARGRRQRNLKGDHDQVDQVPIEMLIGALSSFWPVRHHIFDLPSDISPEAVIAAAFLASLGEVAIKDAGIMELSAAYEEIKAAYPKEAASIFDRLWWLAEFLEGSPLGRTSDMLVASGQSSPDWRSVLAAAAEIPVKIGETSVDRDRFYDLLDRDTTR